MSKSSLKSQLFYILRLINSKPGLISQFETDNVKIRFEIAVVLHFETDKVQIRFDFTVVLHFETDKLQIRFDFAV